MKDSRMGTHMKLRIARTLTRANQNSTSPYPLTPNRFIAIIKTKKMVTQTAEEIGLFQY